MSKAGRFYVPIVPRLVVSMRQVELRLACHRTYMSAGFPLQIVFFPGAGQRCTRAGSFEYLDDMLLGSTRTFLLRRQQAIYLNTVVGVFH